MKKRKEKKHDTAWWKKAFWKVFTRYVKTRDNWCCFTCGKFSSGHGMGGGHFISAGACPPSLYFHEDNVHAQCTHCNLVLEGNHYIYGIKLGKKIVAKLYKLKEDKRGEVWSIEDYKAKIIIYKEKLHELER